MIMDKENLLSDQQSLVLAAGTHLASNVMDLGAPGTLGGYTHATTGATASIEADYAKGVGGELVVQMTQTATSGGAATLQVQIISDDDSAMGSPTVLASSAAIPLASLTAGYQFRVALPEIGITERYLSVQYVIGVAALTAGKVTAGLVLDRQAHVGA